MATNDFTINVLNPVELKNNSLTVKASGQQFQVSFEVEFYSKEQCKFYANIDPDAQNPMLNMNGAHYDNISHKQGPFQGKGKIKITLKSSTPQQKGLHKKSITLGMMHPQDWTKSYLHLEFPFNLLVE